MDDSSTKFGTEVRPDDYKNMRSWFVKLNLQSKAVKAISCSILAAMIQFIPVLILYMLSKYMSSAIELTKFEAWVLVFSLFLSVILQTFFSSKRNKYAASVSSEFYFTLMSALYKKVFNLSAAGRKIHSYNSIVTMLTEDATHIRIYLFMRANMISAPIQIIVCLFWLYDLVGWLFS